MKHELRCFSAALVFIALISTPANGQNQRRFHSNESSADEAALCLIGHFFEGAFPADTPVNVPRPDSKPFIIPEDTAVGMLIHKVNPEYPGIAKAARISGIVTVKAKISTAGEISDLHVECGP